MCRKNEVKRWEEKAAAAAGHKTQMNKIRGEHLPLSPPPLVSCSQSPNLAWLWVCLLLFWLSFQETFALS